MRIGIFGGSFDPVHYGHLLLAECCREEVPLDEVWFVPAAVPPHKQDARLSADKHRLEMLRLAVGGQEAFVVSALEIEQGGVNYTYQTLETIHEQRPDDELFFLMGGDSLRDLPTWRRPQRICELAIPLVVHRPDAPPVDFGVLADVVSDSRLGEIKNYSVAMPLIDLSSTDIRRRTAAGQSIRYRTAPAVEQYIRAHRLYM